MAMALNDYVAMPFGEKGPRVYSGTDAPSDNAIFNANDWYIRTDSASGGPWLYVATAASGTWKSVGNLA